MKRTNNVPGITVEPIDPKTKSLQSEVILLRGRGRDFQEQTEQNITVINEDITTIDSSITTINETLDGLDEIYVKSVPIREIVVIERSDWEDIAEPDESILYCVYDA